MAKAKRTPPSKSELPGVGQDDSSVASVATLEPPAAPKKARQVVETREFYTASASVPYTDPEDPNQSNYAGRERRVDTRKLTKSQWDLLQGIRAACVCKNVKLNNDAPVITCSDVFKYMLEQFQASLED